MIGNYNFLDEWNIIEEKIKIVKNTTGVLPFASVNELRYAGRAIVDTLNKSRTSGQFTINIEDFKIPNRFFNHAKHDLIESLINYYLNKENLFKNKFLSDYGLFKESITAFTESVNICLEKISESRKNRDKRDEIYNELFDKYFDEIIENIKHIDSELLKAQIRKSNSDRKHLYINVLFLLLGIAIPYIIDYFLAK